jgi:N-acetylglutamate synthase-like GNAT family acetyltransferase
MSDFLLGTRLSFRRAVRSDARGIGRLQSLSRRPKRADSRVCDYFVVEQDEVIVACAGLRCRRGVGYLYGLTVHPRWRRHGIGHALTSRRLDVLRKRNLDDAYVLAMFWNVRFFKSHGFRLIDRKNARDLAWLHSDFSEAWCRHSALLFASLSAGSSERT